ncbi:hypothetical protein [Methylobacterium sp. JK268]
MPDIPDPPPAPDPSRPFRDFSTRLLSRDPLDHACLSRSTEALAVSREILRVPVYRPLRGLAHRSRGATD